MTTATAAPPLAADLVLARLAVPSKRPPVPSVVRKDVEKLTGRPLSADEYAALRDELLAAGLAESAPGSRGGFQPTAAGRERALAFLGMAEFPTRTSWRAVKVKYLTAKALGVSADVVGKFVRDQFEAFVVRRKYDLPAGTGTSMSAALEALACQQLGFPDETTLNGVLRVVLSRLAGTDEKLTKDQLKKQLPAKAVEARRGGKDALRATLIAQMLTGDAAASSTEPEPAEPFDLPAFAGTVRRLATDAPADGRFGSNKVFIAAVWRLSQAEPGFPRLTLDAFKARLVEANRAGLLTLSRADFVQGMDPESVRESETAYLNATFHFVTLEDRP